MENYTFFYVCLQERFLIIMYRNVTEILDDLCEHLVQSMHKHNIFIF